jgi:pilus assembly protein CpaB
MGMRTMLVVVLALVFGISAAMAVSRMRSSAVGEVKVESVSVVVAARNIERGKSLARDYVTVREWPKDQVPEGAASEIDEVVDRAVLFPLVRGEPVLHGKLSDGHGWGMAALLKPGMRAFTILSQSKAVGVGGFILPGNRVDVLMTVISSGRDDETDGGSTTTLLQGIEVLAVDNNLDPTKAEGDESVPDRLRSVTLQVTPEQATKLTLAQNRGLLNLSLRRDGDAAPAESAPVTMRDLRYDQSRPVGGEYEATAIVPAADRRTELEPLRPASAELRPVAANSPVYRFRIRTLRGTQSGEVQLHAVFPPNDEPRIIDPEDLAPSAPTVLPGDEA